MYSTKNSKWFQGKAENYLMLAFVRCKKKILNDKGAATAHGPKFVNQF